MRLHRLLGILSIMLSRETIPAKELSEKFNVSIRTIYRDIKVIEESGIPLYTVPGNGGGIGIVPEYKLNKSVLSNDEVNYLMTGISGLKTITDTDKLQILLSKLSPANNYITDDSDIIIDFSSWNKNTTEVLKKKIDIIRIAIMNKNYLNIKYISSRKKSNLKIAPSKVVFKNSSWYLFGKSLSHKEFRFYKISRIVKINTINEQFVEESTEIPINWSDDFDDYSGEKIILGFDKSMEYQVIDIFGEDGYMKDEDDCIIVKFNCSNRDWVIHFALSFGNKAKIIYPTDLKDKYLEYLREIINKNNC
ncbi:YafY family protein [Clostridium intestinale]|uniref:helix-turn-helix transcriptional regulator n=1 Tax=Clostridium intestinale TaxID=36845 RepID=UPI002DD66782|nr:YafY family protein [Clostridium intestinale]WRY52110.1 YafY family protein [Clostridium intestinale]